MNNMMNNPMQVFQALTQFSRSINGNPQQMIMQAMQSGRLNQNQLNQAQQMASQIQQMIKGLK